MAKLTKEQNAKFDRLFNDTIYWGDEDECGQCSGLFAGAFGENLEKLSTGVNEDKLELHLYYCAGIYDASGIGVLPINNKTKSRLKKIVQYISENGFDDFNIKNF